VVDRAKDWNDEASGMPAILLLGTVISVLAKVRLLVERSW
jgi:hypothetical protein